jgi:hypothetical protein
MASDLIDAEKQRFRILVEALRGETVADVDVSILRATHKVSGDERAMIVLTVVTDEVTVVPIGLLIEDDEVDDFELEVPAEVVTKDVNSLLSGPGPVD